MIRLITENDIPGWIPLIREVEPLFGSMVDDPDFLPAIKEAIKANIVFGYENDQTREIAGVVTINRDMNSVEWLAVSTKSKNEGIGSKLLQKAIDELNVKEDITVQTFSEEVEAGTAARKLYQKYGFITLKNSGLNPAGINTVIMVRRSS